MSMKLFDSHCHVDEPRFDEDRGEVLERMAQHGIARCAVVGSDMETSAHCVQFAAEHPGCAAVVGIHPHEAKGFREEDLTQLADWYRQGRACAIGEIGLDYYYDLSPREEQQRVCMAQLELAYTLGAPVVFHVRDAHGDMLELLRARKGRLPSGIIHCYSGSWESAQEYLRMGFYLSFAGPLTFKKAPHLQQVAIRAPRERLLIETDSPYLSPEPVRGRRNEPANVRFVAEKLAALRGEPLEDVCAYTYANACRVYGLHD